MAKPRTKKQSHPKYKKFAVVDLFCGAGGLTNGFIQEKFNVVAGVDFDASCKYAFETNNKAKFLHKDLNKTPVKVIEALYPANRRRILIGCAPCQAFSTYGQRYKDSDKWKLLYSFGRIINQIQPEIISMENVPQLKKYRNRKVFNDFLKVLYDSDYHVWHDEVRAQENGVPQHRTRLILMASRLGPIELIEKTHDEDEYITVKQAISHLPKISAGETHKKDELHKARSLSELNLKRIRTTPEGGGWKDWKYNLINKCHKKKTGKSYVSVYGRMRWDDLSPALTTQCTGYGNGRYGHPVQDRAISLREAAILQSFPEDYEFIDDNSPFYHSWVEKHIGNAVPVLLAKAIAKSIKNHIREYG